jgi:hypothetical protein
MARLLIAEVERRQDCAACDLMNRAKRSLARREPNSCTLAMTAI